MAKVGNRAERERIMPANIHQLGRKVLVPPRRACLMLRKDPDGNPATTRR